MNLKLKHGILSLVALFLAGATLFFSTLNNNSSQMKNVSFGYPFKFVTQDFSDHDKAFSFFPRYETVDLLKRPIQHFATLNFVFSFVIILIVLEVVIFVLEWFKYKIGTWYWSRK